MFHSILVPLDGSSCSEAALKPAVNLAKRFNSQLTIMRVSVIPECLIFNSVTQTSPAYREISQDILATTDTYLKEMKERYGGLYPMKFHTCSGDAATELLVYAQKHDIDLIVISTHGRSGFQRMLFGSVAEKVIRSATCPVLSVRPSPGNLDLE